MLSTDTIEKAIELFDGGANKSRVAEATGISPDEAKAVAEALRLGEADRLFREVALAGVLESAALALRSGRGLIGGSAGDVVREIWHSFPGAGFGAGDADRNKSAQCHDVGGLEQKGKRAHEHPPQTEFTKTCSSCGCEFKHAIPYPWHYIDEKGWHFFCSRECCFTPSEEDVRRMIIERGEDDTEKWS
jgi:hypothetical protein